MKKFSIENLVLMMLAMTGAVYEVSSTVLHHKLLLKRIKEDAIKVEESGKQLDLQVMRPIHDSHRCGTMFFCQAEKSLEQATRGIEKTHSLKMLFTSLEIYNNKTASGNCSLHTNHAYDLLSFLKSIEDCVDFLLMDMNNV